MLAKYLQNLLAMSLGSERRVLFDINEGGSEVFVLRLLSISFASIYREFCVVLSSFVFDVTLISVGRILTADQIVCAKSNDWLRCLEYTTFFGTVI